MKIITINIPDENADWILDGIALRYRYPTTIDNPSFDASLGIDASTNPFVIPNPETKEEFAKQQIINFLKTEATQGYITAEWLARQAEQEAVVIT